MDDEKIVEVQPSPASFSEGDDVMINWTYCKANVSRSSITGFIVYRDLYPRKHVHLLSMDLNGKVSVYIANKENILLNRIDLKRNVHLITFTIKNVIKNDSGYYRLEIRRHGYGNLYSRVKIIVEPLGKYYCTFNYTILYYTILHYTTLHYTTLHYTTLHYTILYYTILYYTILLLVLYYYY